ncbi:hypothetical protein [Clostridioides difficile]|uniref:Uncharacterized protein n=2 Tax=Clostridioides difficile TaxID=1496 RepID=A0AAN5VS78_CLODI|nr:hypothetical protein [Clostridioides difficile]EIS9475911.1 hypothetical protein [Clostridioides difficile]EIS9655751.1 hypothetical protein [Clostridioides difficile]MBJ9762051.1 hypothetical protein [Clostridioides difficile]MBZ1123098.1 hypothetical protein [Clostridioides difficile]MCG3620492.1 hypothetical protein [Clostridioides difficile]
MLNNRRKGNRKSNLHFKKTNTILNIKKKKTLSSIEKFNKRHQQMLRSVSAPEHILRQYTQLERVFHNHTEIINNIHKTTTQIGSNSVAKFIQDNNATINALTSIDPFLYQNKIENIVKHSTISYIENMQNNIISSLNLNNFVEEILSKLNFPKIIIDVDRYRIKPYILFFRNNKDISDRFYDEDIFPPIKYFIENDIDNISKDTNLEDLILSEDVRKFYLNQILSWKNKFDDDVNQFINSIHTLLNTEIYPAICLTMFTQIEYLIRYECFPNEGTIPYKTLSSKLKDEVFDKIGISKFYYKFIKNSLYANTKNAKGLSRHSTHGVDLYKMNSKSAMNLIFLYDFIQSVIDIDAYI